MAKSVKHGVVAPEASRGKFLDADFFDQEFGTAGIRVTSETFIVVATQGEHDQEALELALQTSARYISFIASHAKAKKVIALLSEKGVPSETLSRIKAPAGLDIGTSAPEEIAVSILAEIIQMRRGGVSQPGPRHVYETHASRAIVKDPVFGVDVETGESSLSSEYEAKLFYFCCSDCKQTFDKNPRKYKKVGSRS